MVMINPILGPQRLEMHAMHIREFAKLFSAPR